MTDKKPRKQKFLFISRSAPYGSNRALLCMDAAFAAAVFEQEVSYLFMGDGVYQLLTDQNAEAISSKTLGNILETLDLYGIDEVLVDESSLALRNVSETDFVMPARTLAADDIARKIAASDWVINL